MISKAISHIENGKKQQQQQQKQEKQQKQESTKKDNNDSQKTRVENKTIKQYIENPDVIKEGYLGKESVHLKKIRERWMVLKGKYLYSYKEIQVYEDPTETFDLKLYRTAKMCRNGKAFQFELISIKQERRVFIAANKIEMNDWIRCIKKVILFTKDFTNKCRTIRSCLSLKRLQCILKLYQCYTGYNDSIIKYISSYKQLINDYHHILNYHLNEDINNANCKNRNKSQELIYKQLNHYCNINNCQCYIRQHRIREDDEKEYQHNQNNYNQEFIVYRDLLDTIHCSLIHSFDNGYTIKYKTLQSMIEETEDDTQQLIKIKQYLLFHKKRLQKVRGQKRFQLNNKFFINITHEKPLPHLSLLDDDNKYNDNKYNNNNNINDDFAECKTPTSPKSTRAKISFDKSGDERECEFGRRFMYWDHCKMSPFYVSKKYDNLKLEIMDNMFYPLEITKFIETHIKAKKLLNDSNIIKSMSCDGNNPYGIEKNEILNIENIMSLIIYCDFDGLTSHLISTYYPLSYMESDHELIDRHREYWNWSKLLNETVQCFGNIVNKSKIDKYFIITKEQYFDKFMLNFNRPCSMTTNLNISTLYCPDNGIILEMKKTNFYIGELLRYFDCSLISSFSLESEKLFIGGSQSLQLISIRSLKMNKIYKHFIIPFKYFQKIIDGKDILQMIWDNDYLIISNLISSKIINKKQINYCPYIQHCFDKFCHQQKIIKIKLKYLYNFKNNFIHLKCPNLLLFDNLSILFKNCEIIYCGSIGIINTLYLNELIKILNHININVNIHLNINNNNNKKRKKLKKIILSGITNIKLTDNEFLKYQCLIKEKVNWRIETDKQESGILTLIKGKVL